MNLEKMKSKSYIPVLALLMLVMVFTLSLGFQSPTKDNYEDEVKYNSLVQVYKNNELISQNHNTLTNIGKDMIQSAIGGATVVNATFLAVGNGSAPVAGDTSLNAEITTCGLAAKGATIYDNTVSNGNWTLSNTWTSACNNQIVNTTGLYNYTSGTKGNLFAGTSYTSTSLQINDVLSINYTIYVS